MTNSNSNSFVLLVCFCVLVPTLFLAACKGEVAPNPPVTEFFPASDPNNNGGWILNEEVSDEFTVGPLDEEKWLIQGRDGEYKSSFIGRAPSQFSTENVRIENEMLKITTKWDPDFEFSSDVQTYGNGTSYNYENITTAAVISKKYFYHGYMEIRCKIADISVSNAFWTTGPGVELDVFEFIGNPAQSWKEHLKKEYKFTIHDWSSQGGGAPIWSHKHELPWEVSSGFHTYGCEWDANGLKFFADGEMVKSVTKEEMGEDWIMTSPLWVWVDAETFPWHGLPTEADLPADFEIDYIRVWKKE